MYHAQNTQPDKTTDCGYLGTGSRNILLPVVPMTLSRERNGIFEGKEWHFRGVTRYRNTSFLPSEHLERIIRTTRRRHPFHALPFPSSMTDSTERFTRDFLFSISQIPHGNSLIIRPFDVVILKIEKKLGRGRNNQKNSFHN